MNFVKTSEVTLINQSYSSYFSSILAFKIFPQNIFIANSFQLNVDK